MRPTSKTTVLPTLIIGGGPAGLAAACALAERGASTRVVETGLDADLRDHENPTHLGMGVGGCGLFSDGKFSFRPSATRLWELADREALHASEVWATALLEAEGLQRPAAEDGEPTELRSGSGIVHKQYPSLYLPLAARRSLIRRLLNTCGDRPVVGKKVIRLEWADQTFHCTVQDQSGMTEEVLADAVILATGRLGPLDMPGLLPEAPTIFRRVELGVRIEHRLDVGPLATCSNTDVKLIYAAASDTSIEWRTFCSCRRGRVVGIPYTRLSSYSGRADDEPTEVSNFGLNLRLSEPTTATDALNCLVRADAGGDLPPPIALREIIQGAPAPDAQQTSAVASLASRFGSYGWSRLVEGVQTLVRAFPDLDQEDTVVYGPAVEGIGSYPALDARLRVPSFPLWVAGDATGLFRGNTAALVSGYFCGLQAWRRHHEHEV